MVKTYESKFFCDRRIIDHINLKENPLQVHFIKNKKDEGYYLGLYLNELANDDSIEVNGLTVLAYELRRHDDFFVTEAKVSRRLDYIQAKLEPY